MSLLSSQLWIVDGDFPLRECGWANLLPVTTHIAYTVPARGGNPVGRGGRQAAWPRSGCAQAGLANLTTSDTRRLRGSLGLAEKRRRRSAKPRISTTWSERTP